MALVAAAAALLGAVRSEATAPAPVAEADEPRALPAAPPLRPWALRAPAAPGEAERVIEERRSLDAERALLERIDALPAEQRALEARGTVGLPLRFSLDEVEAMARRISRHRDDLAALSTALERAGDPERDALLGRYALLRRALLEDVGGKAAGYLLSAGFLRGGPRFDERHAGLLPFGTGRS